MFECHVILSSSKPGRPWQPSPLQFECHVILSSSKPSKRWGFLIDLCSKWAQVLLRFLCAFQAEMYAKNIGPCLFENHTILLIFKMGWSYLPYKICLSTMQFYSSSKALFRFRTKSCLFENHVISSSFKLPFCGDRRSCSFEYHVILLFFQSSIGRSLSIGLFENHAILPFSKAGITMKKFENHVILSSAKPFAAVTISQ